MAKKTDQQRLSKVRSELRETINKVKGLTEENQVLQLNEEQYILNIKKHKNAGESLIKQIDLKCQQIANLQLRLKVESHKSSRFKIALSDAQEAAMVVEAQSLMGINNPHEIVEMTEARMQGLQ